MKNALLGQSRACDLPGIIELNYLCATLFYDRSRRDLGPIHERPKGLRPRIGLIRQLLGSSLAGNFPKFTRREFGQPSPARAQAVRCIEHDLGGHGIDGLA